MGSPQNTVTYGLFTFPFAKVTTASGVLYAEDGFTRIGRRYQFTITGWIGGTTQLALSSTILSMQDILKTPRLDLRIHWDGDGSTDLFFYVPTTGTTSAGSDIDWGPKPGELNISQFAGGRAAFYTWTCSVNTMDTPLKSNVLAATWQWSHVVDPSGYTTRTVRGKILVDSGVVAAGQGADYYRNVVAQALPVLLYFKRESQEYTQSEDGRVLSFSVTDTETYYTLPNPITAGHANWMVRLHGIGEADALMVDYVLSGWFESSANHPKSDVIAAIMNLVSAKFGSVGDNTLIFGERVLREDVYGRNRIDFSISAIQPGGGASSTTGNINLNVGLQTFGVQPPDSDGVSISINPYGETEGLTSGAFARAPLLYDADPPTGVNQSGGYQFADAGDPGVINAPSGSGKGGPPSTGPTSPLVGNVSQLMQKNPFIAFHEVISYEIDNHIVMLAPKSAAADPIVQQTAVPTLTVIQAGYSRQIAKTPSGILFGNAKAFLPPDFICSGGYISTPNGEPIAEGIFSVWTTEWRYTFVKAKQPTADDGQTLPFDPRTDASGNNLTIKSDQLPVIIVDPNTPSS